MRETERLDAERHLAELSIRRDASLAWLDCWRGEADKKVAIETLDAAQLQAQALAIGARSGSADQSDCVAALLNADRLCDAVVARQQASDAAAPTSFRARFGPWIFLQRVFG